MIAFINCNNSNPLAIFFVSHYILNIELVFLTTYNQLWCSGSPRIGCTRLHNRCSSTYEPFAPKKKGMLRQAVPPIINKKKSKLDAASLQLATISSTCEGSAHDKSSW